MSVGQSVSVQQIIDTGRWTVTQKVGAALGAAAITLDGLDIQILGFAVPAIASEWHLAKSSFAIIFGTSLLAVAAGTIIGGFLGDRYGRRRAIMLSVLWFGVSTILMASSKNFPMLFFYRLISGLGIGAALPNATAFIAEITPARHRTTVVSATIVCIPLGGLVGGLIAAHVLPIASWRVLVLIGGVLPVALGCLLLAVLPESPRFLATRPEKREALLKLLNRFGLSISSETTFLADAVPEQRDGIGTLIRPPFRRDTFSIWAAFCFCLITVYMVFNWLPSMLSTLGLDAAAASRGLVIFNFGGIIGSVLLGILVNRIGSRIPILVTAAAAVLSALWLAFHLVTPPSGAPLLTLQLGTHGFFVNAVQTLLYALAAHIYPTRFRSRGVAAAAAFGRAGAVLSAFLGGNALKHSGPEYFFILAITMSGVAISLCFLRNHIPSQGAVVALKV